MSHKKKKKNTTIKALGIKILSVMSDISFAYKNFIHWNISKILISTWCFILGVIISLPIFIFIIIVGLFDPINWSEIIAYILTGSDVSNQIIGGIAMHPYNLIFIVFLLIVMTCLFILGSSYSLFLKSELSLAYIKGKKLKYSKNQYFNRSFITCHLGIICWSFMYVLAPIIIWAGLVFFVYLFYNIGFIGFDGLSIWIGIYTLTLIFSEVYLLYRIVFGPILLADDSKKKKQYSSLYYVKKSVKITKGKHFFTFVLIYILFVLFLMPSTLLDNYLEKQGILMRDTLIYNSGLLENLEPKQVQYYEYITKEFNDLTNEEISSKLDSLTALRFIVYFMSYLLFSGVFALLLTSFYKRVLVGK